jgi:hypothetical protein
MRVTTVLLLLLTNLTAQAADPPSFSIKHFGAIEEKDGKNKCTDAIHKAIDEATRAKTYDTTGAIVRIPKGRWLTGPIVLKSNITLHLEKDALLIFAGGAEDDPPIELTRWEGIECYNYAGFIRARGAKNIAITGPGTIDANGKWWWRQSRLQDEARRRLRDLANSGQTPYQRVFGTPDELTQSTDAKPRRLKDPELPNLRPSFIQFIDCQNIRLEGFTLKNVPMWAIHPIYCKDVVATGLRVNALGPDGAGIVPDSCANVTIENSTFDCFEDCIAVKSGRDADGRRVNRPSEDVTVKGCTFIRGASALAIGSETSGSVRRVTLTRSYMKGLKRGLRIKTQRGRGGAIEDVKFTHCKLDEVGETAVHIDMQYNPTKPDDFAKEEIPTIDKVLIWGIETSGGWQPWLIRGLPEAPIKTLDIVEVKLKSDRGIECRHVDGAQVLHNEVWAKEGWALYAGDVEYFQVKYLKPLNRPEKGAVIAVRDARHFTLHKTHAPEETDIFLRVAGKNSNNITLENCDTRDAKQPVKLEDGAPADAAKEAQ